MTRSDTPPAKTAGADGARLSIIVPVLNEAPILCESLTHLQPFRSRGAELIVVDGGSRDGSAETARSLADTVLSSPPGRARQMNAGAGVASGDVLLFLHADTRLPPDADLQIAAALERGDAVWGRFDVRLSGRGILLRVVEFFMNLRSRLTAIATGDQAIFVRRATFARIGGFALLALMEDVALSTRLKRESAPVCLRARVVASSRRWEREGVLRTICLMWWLRLAFFVGADPSTLARRYYRRDASPP